MNRGEDFSASDYQRYWKLTPGSSSVWLTQKIQDFQSNSRSRCGTLKLMHLTALAL
jgi:hypothetical protein